MGGPEIHRSRPNKPTYLSQYLPHNNGILPGVREVYGGMMAGVRFAMDNAQERIPDVESFPLLEPGYPVEYICDHVVEESLCDLDCTNINVFPFDLAFDEQPVQNNTGIKQFLAEHYVHNATVLRGGNGVDPCGHYLQSFGNGRATYLSIQPGTLFREICPDECQDDTSIAPTSLTPTTPPASSTVMPALNETPSFPVGSMDRAR